MSLIDFSYIELRKYKLCSIVSSNLQFTAYNAYISLQKITNLMVKHIARSYFPGAFLRKTNYRKKLPMEKLL